MGRTKKEKSITGILLAVRDVHPEAKIALDKLVKYHNMFRGEYISKLLLKEAQNVFTSKKEIAKPEDVLDKIQEMFDKNSKDFVCLQQNIKKIEEQLNQSFIDKLKKKFMS